MSNGSPGGGGENVFCHNAALSANNFYRMFGDTEHRPYEHAELREISDVITSGVDSIRDNTRIPAGYTYFGQMIAHDLSNRKGNVNERTSALDLDGIYGRPDEQEGIYDTGLTPKRFKLGRHFYSGEEDILREPGTNEPRIPDVRNNFHFIICQLHLAFIKFHHAIQDELSERRPLEAVFGEARRVVTYYYHRVIVDDFLRRVCDERLLDRLWGAPGERSTPASIEALGLEDLISLPRDSQLPLEFVLAGFRFGHAMVRRQIPAESLPAYRLSRYRRIWEVFEGVLDDGPEGEFNALPIHWTIQWDRFLDITQGKPPQFSRKISPSIIDELADLPDFTIANIRRLQPERNLAMRTLNAGNDQRIVSGQEAALRVREIYRRLNLGPVTVLDPASAQYHDPLWYYVLREADQLAGGERLGPVGSLIVAFTITEVLRYGKCGRGAIFAPEAWFPTVGTAGNPVQLADIIRRAGSPVTFEDWRDYTGAET